MKSLITILIIALATSGFTANFPAKAISFGPLWHWNFGGEKVKFSWAFEVAYWQSYGHPEVAEPHLHGFDLGIEFQGDTRRIYGEYQNGLILVGGSIGPVLEMREGQYKFGLQSGLWGAFIAGLNIRALYLLNDGFTFAPGLFLKLPLDLNNGDYGIEGN